MAKGPATLYKELLAKAKRNYELGNDDITNDYNRQNEGYGLYEKDVIIYFMRNNYGEKKTERCIRTWADYDLIDRLTYRGYRLIGFFDGVMS